MSTRYFISPAITKEDLHSRTDLRIVKPETSDCEWIIDKYGNDFQLIGVDNIEFGTFVKYMRSNPRYLFDTLISEFNIRFASEYEVYYTDEENPLSEDEMEKECMESCGYSFDENNNVILPERIESDYHNHGNVIMTRTVTQPKPLFKFFNEGDELPF